MTASEGLRRRSEAVKRMQRDELKGHAASIRSALIRSAKGATGGDRRLSGLGNKPTLGVSVRTETGGRTTTVTIKPSPKEAVAPWQWTESGTKPGRRAVRRSARLRSRRESQTTGVGAYWHPGTKATQGKKAWSKPIAAELPKVRAGLKQHFKQIVKG